MPKVKRKSSETRRRERRQAVAQKKPTSHMPNITKTVSETISRERHQAVLDTCHKDSYIVPQKNNLILSKNNTTTSFLQNYFQDQK